MSAVRVLLVEDNPTWQAILETYIRLALPDADVQIAADFREAVSALGQGNWDLLVTDIGLPPDSGYVLGIQLANHAKLKAVPCIVVSGSQSVTKQHVRDLFRDYHVRDFFSKEDLATRPDMQITFQGVVRECATMLDAPVAEEPLDPRSPPPRKVTIGTKSNSIYVGSDGVENLVIPSGTLEKVFLFFALKVVEGLPAKVVANTVLNEIVEMAPDETASQPLRNTIKQLNDMFRNWGHTGDSRWIVRGRGEHGYCLNTEGVQWDVEKELKKQLRGGRTLWDVLVDPQRMAASTPDKEYRWPARRKAKPSSGEDEDT